MMGRVYCTGGEGGVMFLYAYWRLLTSRSLDGGSVNARYQEELGFGRVVSVLFCTFRAFVLLSNTNPFSLA
jgi:hypothetical protein